MKPAGAGAASSRSARFHQRVERGSGMFRLVCRVCTLSLTPRANLLKVSKTPRSPRLRLGVLLCGERLRTSRAFVSFASSRSRKSSAQPSRWAAANKPTWNAGKSRKRTPPNRTDPPPGSCVSSTCFANQDFVRRHRKLGPAVFRPLGGEGVRLKRKARRVGGRAWLVLTPTGCCFPLEAPMVHSPESFANYKNC